MQIFSPLNQLTTQPVPLGSSGWDHDVESEDGTAFDACFSELLATDDGAGHDDCSRATRQDAEKVKDDDLDTNQEDFSPVKGHDNAQARENVAGDEELPDAQDKLLSRASTTPEDDLNKLMDQLVALLPSGSRDQVAHAQSEVQGRDDEGGRFQLSSLEGKSQQVLNLVDDTGDLKTVLRRLEQVLAAKDGGQESGSDLVRKMQALDVSSKDMEAIRDMLRNISGTDGRNMVQSGGPSPEQARPGVDAKTEISADSQTLQTLLNDKVHMDPSKQGQEEPQRLFPGQGSASEKTSAREAAGQVRVGEFQEENAGTGDQKSGVSDRGTSGDSGFANLKDHGSKTPETPSRSNGLLAQTLLENESLDQPKETIRSNVSRNVLDQVQQGVFRNLSQGRKQLSLQLDPADLGTVNVILQVKGKEVNAVLKTSHEDTSRILGEQMVQLKDHLEKQGLKVVKLEVQNQLASDEQPGQWSGGSQHNQSRERLEAGMRELRWRSLRGEGEVLARDVQNGEHRVNVSPRGVDFFA